MNIVNIIQLNCAQLNEYNDEQKKFILEERFKRKNLLKNYKYDIYFVLYGKSITVYINKNEYIRISLSHLNYTINSLTAGSQNLKDYYNKEDKLEELQIGNYVIKNIEDDKTKKII